MILSLHDDNIVVMNIKLFVGLGIVNCIYFNRGMNNYGLQIIRFMTQILIRKQKQKSVEEIILNAINNKNRTYARALHERESECHSPLHIACQRLICVSPEENTISLGSKTLFFIEFKVRNRLGRAYLKVSPRLRDCCIRVW